MRESPLGSQKPEHEFFRRPQIANALIERLSENLEIPGALPATRQLTDQSKFVRASGMDDAAQFLDFLRGVRVSHWQLKAKPGGRITLCWVAECFEFSSLLRSLHSASAIVLKRA